MKKTTILLLAMASTFATADEGMWQPHQLPSIASELTQAGLKLNPNDLT
ncbi:MAG: hypothetical protein ACI9YH_003680, partial [Colwellia sp.]